MVAASLRRVSLETSDRDIAEERLAALSREEARRPFDLAAPPLFRAVLVRMEPERHVLLLTMHHLVSDGRSVEILLAELMRVYAAGEAAGPPALPIAYADYARWQRDWLEAGELDRQLSWWRERLGATETVIPLPTDRPARRFRVSGARRWISPSMPMWRPGSKPWRGRPAQPVPWSSSPSCPWSSGAIPAEADLRIGIPVANRNRPETEGLVGLFVNTLAIRSPSIRARASSTM